MPTRIRPDSMNGGGLLTTSKVNNGTLWGGFSGCYMRQGTGLVMNTNKWAPNLPKVVSIPRITMTCTHLAEYARNSYWRPAIFSPSSNTISNLR